MDIIEIRGESSSPKESSQVVVPLVVLQTCNRHRHQINIKNPQDEHIVDKPVDNVHEQVIKGIHEIPIRSLKDEEDQLF